jgi:hypothetical protein
LNVDQESSKGVDTKMLEKHRANETDPMKSEKRVDEGFEAKMSETMRADKSLKKYFRVKS